jgi:hypothetical protein
MEYLVFLGLMGSIGGLVYHNEQVSNRKAQTAIIKAVESLEDVRSISQLQQLMIKLRMDPSAMQPDEIQRSLDLVAQSILKLDNVNDDVYRLFAFVVANSPIRFAIGSMVTAKNSKSFSRIFNAGAQAVAVAEEIIKEKKQAHEARAQRRAAQPPLVPVTGPDRGQGSNPAINGPSALRAPQPSPGAAPGAQPSPAQTQPAQNPPAVPSASRVPQPAIAAQQPVIAAPQVVQAAQGPQNPPVSQPVVAAQQPIPAVQPQTGVSAPKPATVVQQAGGANPQGAQNPQPVPVQPQAAPAAQPTQPAPTPVQNSGNADKKSTSLFSAKSVGVIGGLAIATVLAKWGWDWYKNKETQAPTDKSVTA